MTFAYVFGAKFVQISVSKSLVNETGNGMDSVNERTVIARFLVLASCLVG